MGLQYMISCNAVMTRSARLVDVCDSRPVVASGHAYTQRHTLEKKAFEHCMPLDAKENHCGRPLLRWEMVLE